MTTALASLLRPWSVDRTRSLMLDPSRPVWRDALVLAFDQPVRPEVARQWLPPAFRLPAQPRALVFVANYPDTSFGIPYRECGVLLHATLRGKPVLHCAWMAVDDDTAMILGRELLGFPKKIAAIELRAADGMVFASVCRRETELLRFTGRLGDALAPQAAFQHPIVNLRGIPGLAPGVLLRMDVPERFRTGQDAVGDVVFGGSPYDPLTDLLSGGSTPARLMRVDIGVPPEGAGFIPPGIRPVGLVSPLWLARAYPFRTM